MKRRDLIRHVERQGCQLLREGGRHSVYFNPKTTKPPPFPGTERSTKYLAKKICRDLGIAEP